MEQTDCFCECSVIHEDSVRAALDAMPPAGALEDMSAFFKVLGDKTRISILWALDSTELCVCDIAAVLNMTKSAVSHQLNTLRQAKLVKARRDGKNVYYSLDDQHVTSIIEVAMAHLRHK